MAFGPFHKMTTLASSHWYPVRFLFMRTVRYYEAAGFAVVPSLNWNLLLFRLWTPKSEPRSLNNDHVYTFTCAVGGQWWEARTPRRRLLRRWHQPLGRHLQLRTPPFPKNMSSVHVYQERNVSMVQWTNDTINKPSRWVHVYTIWTTTRPTQRILYPRDHCHRQDADTFIYTHDKVWYE